MRHLSTIEINYLDNLLNGRVSLRPQEGALTGEGLIELRKVFAEERQLRRESIPEDWREQASEFLATKGAYKLVPGIAGGRMLPEGKDKTPRLKIVDEDQLLMLLGAADDLVPEE